MAETAKRIGADATPADVQQWLRHIREAHPNLLGYPTSWVAYAPLPESGLSDEPPEWVYAIHMANHAGLYRRHLDDEYLPPQRHEVTRDHIADLLANRDIQLPHADGGRTVTVTRMDLSGHEIDHLLAGLDVTVVIDSHTVVLALD